MSASGRETEIKLKADDAASAVAMLEHAGFRVLKPRVFEANTVLDGEGQPLRSSGRLLRLRQAGDTTTLTYKGPAASGRHKSREELETVVLDAAQAALLFERLGYQPLFRYEKYRTEFENPASPGGIATVDETPVGVYIELEGEPEWIDRHAAALGFTDADYITQSYARLYLAWCERQGVPPTHMVFPSGR